MRYRKTNQNPEIGEVFIAYNEIAKKPKLFVVIGISEDRVDVIYCLINSELTDYQRRNPDVLKTKMPLSANGRAYLDHDSFLDCEAPIWENISLFKEKVSPRDCLGKMSQLDIEAAKRTICLSPRKFSRQDMRDMGIQPETLQSNNLTGQNPQGQAG